MVSKKRVGIFLIAVGLLWGAPWPQEVLAGTLSFDGATTLGDQFIPEAAKAFESKSGIKFDKIASSGATQGFTAMMAEEVSFTGLPRGLTPAERGQKPYEHIIGWNAIAVWVNDKNPVKNLSKKQLQDIFTGKVTNWQAVGGPDAKINVVILEQGRATPQLFKALTFPDQEYKVEKEFSSVGALLKHVAASPYAITHASIGATEEGVKMLTVDKVICSPKTVRAGDYPYRGPIMLVSKNRPQGDVKKFFDFMLSAEGQVLVTKYFLPLN